VSIKGLLLIALWALLGVGINTQFDPTTVIGSVAGSVFIFIWVAILVIGVFSWIKLKKFKDK
jgi:hypothetical protein|tara:strand:- start:277 stop:462 length:186 start_codon:yes stop_codon:yes gene_type:complete